MFIAIKAWESTYMMSVYFGPLGGVQFSVLVVFQLLLAINNKPQPSSVPIPQRLLDSLCRTS